MVWYKVKECQTDVTVRDIGTSPPREGCVTPQATFVSTFSICKSSPWHANYWNLYDIYGLVFGTCPRGYYIEDFLKVQTRSELPIDKQRFHVLFSTDCPTQVPNKSRPKPNPSQTLSVYPLLNLPTTPVPLIHPFLL